MIWKRGLKSLRIHRNKLLIKLVKKLKPIKGIPKRIISILTIKTKRTIISIIKIIRNPTTITTNQISLSPGQVIQ